MAPLPLDKVPRRFGQSRSRFKTAFVSPKLSKIRVTDPVVEQEETISSSSSVFKLVRRDPRLLVFPVPFFMDLLLMTLSLFLALIFRLAAGLRLGFSVFFSASQGMKPMREIPPCGTCCERILVGDGGAVSAGLLALEYAELL